MLRLGYSKGQNYVVVERMTGGGNGTMAAMAEDLVSRKVDLILTGGTEAALEAQRATSTIPIVFVSVGDPVGVGIAVSLSRPGHNLTGISSSVAEIAGKRLQLLKQIVPGLTRVTVLLTPKMPNYPAFVPRLKASAQALDMELVIVEASVPLNLEQVFQALAAARPQAIYEAGDPYLFAARKELAARLLRARLPASFANFEHVEEGGLMSYGADSQDLMRQIAIFIDKIFSGLKPGELPIELPSKIDLVINARTADSLHLKIPQALLLQASRLIE